MDKCNFYINSTLVANTIRKGIDYGKVYSIKSVKQANTDLLIENNNKSSESTEPISYIDMMIMDAVYSLYCANDTRISPGKILRMLSGNEKQTCRKETRERIRNSLKKMTELYINLDYMEEMKWRKKELAYKGKVAFVELTGLNNEGAKYSILESLPVIYEYAECLQQRISIPWDVWRFYAGKESVMQDSLDNIALKHYLFQRIHTANYLKSKNPKSRMEKIYYYHLKNHRYEGMLFELGIVSREEITDNADGEKNNNEAVRKKLAVIKRKIHENTKKILEIMIKKEYIIDGFTLINGSGREIIGVETSLKDAKK